MMLQVENGRQEGELVDGFGAHAHLEAICVRV